MEKSLANGNQPTRGEDVVVIGEQARARAIGENSGVSAPRDSNSETPTARESRSSEITQDNQEAELERADDGSRDAEQPGELTESEKEQVERLKARDAEVRRHEQAHLTAAGDLANGPPSYDFQRGPDGRNYAVGGSVSIDVSPEAEPADTIAKAERIKRAALAPAEPSGQDRRVAARADALKLEAQQELAQDQREEVAAAAEARGEKAEGAPGVTGPEPTNSLGTNTPDNPANGSRSNKRGLSSAPTNASLAGPGTYSLSGGFQSNEPPGNRLEAFA